MNYINKLNIEHFRNFDKLSIDLNNRWNVILGDNGSGKTNILESISLFEIGRGLRKDRLINMINNKNKHKMFILNAKFMIDKDKFDQTIFCELNHDKLNKKVIINGKKSNDRKNYYEKLYSIMWFIPEMERIFITNPSLRRNFIDRLIYGADRNYLKILTQYKKKISERNKILNYNQYDEDWIEQVENEIIEIGLIIYKKRKQHIHILNSNILSILNLNKAFDKFKLLMDDQLFNNLEKSEDNFKSMYLLKLKSSRNYDSILGGCKIGPHKTNIYGLQLDKKIYASQLSTGQQKTFVLLIIIAQCKYLIDNLNIRPIVLLDEICSYLDDQNRKLLLEIINNLEAQIFMTGIKKDFFSFLSTKANYYNIS